MNMNRMDYAEFRITHRHPDGSWGDLALVPTAGNREPSSEHDVAAHDPERQWHGGRLFRCTSCGQQVILTPAETSGNTGPR
jgi:hypothetical protein